LALLPACGPSSASARAELCRDLTNLEATVAYLAAPPPDATVGDVRGALEKTESTWEAVRDDADVPDAEDDAMQDPREDYDDAIGDFGDDDLFAMHAAETAGIARRLAGAYAVVRGRLGCPPSPSAG
jgi:hypothetical protein